jgi:hypothetical protein
VRRLLLVAATAIILLAPAASARSSAPTAGSVPGGGTDLPSDATGTAAVDGTEPPERPTDATPLPTGSSTTALLIRVAAVSLLGGPVLVAVARRRVTAAHP